MDRKYTILLSGRPRMQHTHTYNAAFRCLHTNAFCGMCLIMSRNASKGQTSALRSTQILFIDENSFRMKWVEVSSVGRWHRIKYKIYILFMFMAQATHHLFLPLSLRSASYRRQLGFTQNTMSLCTLATIFGLILCRDCREKKEIKTSRGGVRNRNGQIRPYARNHRI